MQLNVYVPNNRAALLVALDAAAKKRLIQKNTLVLDAIEHYLNDVLQAEAEGVTPKLETFDMGEIRMPARQDLYDEYLDGLFGGDRDPA